jgi:hypothetical protein
MSATPEQIAERLEALAFHGESGEFPDAVNADLRAAASLIRAQSERERVLVSALKRTHQTLCVPAAEYVPAIRDCFDIIDAALKATP